MKRKTSRVTSGIKRGGAALKWRRTAKMIKTDVRDAHNLTKVFEAAALIPVAKIIGYPGGSAPPTPGGGSAPTPPGARGGAKRAMTDMLNVAPNTCAPLSAFEELGCEFLLLGRGDSITEVHAVGARVYDMAQSTTSASPGGLGGGAPAPDPAPGGSHVLMLREMHGKAFPLSAERVKGARLYVMPSRLDAAQRHAAEQFAAGLPKSWCASLPATDIAEVHRALTALHSDSDD